MAYNTGNFSLFNQTGFTSSTAIYAESISAAFSIPSNGVYTNVYGSQIAPTVVSTGTSTVRNLFGLNLSLSLAASGVTVSVAHTLDIVGPVFSGGTLTNVYSLFVTPPTITAGSAVNNFTAAIFGNVGIGTTTPLSQLSSTGTVAVGSYAGNVAGPGGSLIVSGQVGVGTPTPNFKLDVQGAISAQNAISAGITKNNQVVTLFEGYSQGGYGGGMVGTVKAMGSNLSASFNMLTVNSNSEGFQGGVFDGRYLYFVPNISGDGTTPSGQITRYDTSVSLSVSTSYAIFNAKLNVNSNCVGYKGGVYDGRYTYFIPNVNSLGTASGLILRYDGTLDFLSSTSYATFDMTTVNSNSVGFSGGVFDGRYIYFAPNTNTLTVSGQITRLDTTLLFNTTSSYSIFDTAFNINSNSGGFQGGAYDGRYVYFIPNINPLTVSGQITRYDTTGAFNASSSYSVFDTASLVNSSSAGFFGAVFDGRYLYFVPNANGLTQSGLVTRYDTTNSFLSSSSYSVFDMTAAGSLSQGFAGAAFDGRYIYFAPNLNILSFSSQITRFDTTQSFASANSYSVLNAAQAISSLARGFTGVIFDGRYVYFIPTQNQVSFSGLLARIDGYPGQLANTINASQSLTGLALGTYSGAISAPTNGLAISGFLGIGTATPTYRVDVQGFVSAFPVYSAGTTRNNQVAAISQAYSQGGLGSSSVGSQKGLSSGTFNEFNMALVNSNSVGYAGAVFDGRYVYFAPKSKNLTTFSGLITRYDTTAVFGSSNSYAIFDTTQLSSLSQGFWGGVFDGRYVYLVPNQYNTGTYSGLVVRYDTTALFSASTSYAIADTSVLVNSSSVGFIGAVFDGRYIYYSPNQVSPTTSSGQVTRYDTTGSFTSSGSYATFDTSLVNPNSVGFFGGTYDGRYVYFVPNNGSVGTYLGQITRYDTTGSFSQTISYSIFDLASINNLARGYTSAIFDGRYIYFVPYSNNGGFTGLFVRYDTTLIFNSTTSYTIFDLAANVNAQSLGFTGGSFDGRYITLVPASGSSSVVTRYDTATSFSASASYATLNLQNIDSSLSIFQGSIYDGKYVYLIPFRNSLATYSGTVVRLDAYIGAPVNAINVNQAPFGIAIGTYTGIVTPPTGGLIISGAMGIGTTTPSATLDVQGVLNAQTVLSAGTTRNNQIMTLAEGYNQGGFGGSSVGTQKTLNTLSTLFFDTSTNVNSNSVGFAGSAFDGRYLYLVPTQNTLGSYSGQITRYDTFSSFSSSSSYSIFNTVNLNSYCKGFTGALYDGRYIYFIPNGLNSTAAGTITRYDTRAIFSSTSSYSFFSLALNLNTNCTNYFGGVFDGRYIYLAPAIQTPNVNIFVQYDTTLSFSSSSSYSFIANTSIGVPSGLFFSGAAYDGRYVYYVPQTNFGVTISGQIVQYDTTLPFSTASSFSNFDSGVLLNSQSRGFIGAVYDGRYVYYVPNNNGVGITLSGQITRYDTTAAFSNSNSYAIYDTRSLNSQSCGFWGGVFDGRYVYYVPNAVNAGPTLSGQITRFDTTLSFSVSTSYSFFNTAAVNSNSVGFQGGAFDGKYLYLIPWSNLLTFSGQITRIDAYPGQPVGAIGASFSQRGIAIGTYAGIVTAPSNGLIVSGKVGVGTASPAYNLDVQGGISAQSISSSPYTTKNSQQVALFEGYTQGGFGGGQVGTQKTMSLNTTYYFDMSANINSQSVGYAGSVFDGRYLYFVPDFNLFGSFSGFVTRLDTTSTFSASSSYASFNLGSLNTNCKGYTGGLFDGRYIYFIPNGSSVTTAGILTRYDSTLPFTVSSSYSLFLLPSLNTNCTNYFGGAFDGRYLYLASANTALNIQVRYDTTLSFSNTNSYAFITNTAIGVPATLFCEGATYDGRYIYYSPQTNFGVTISGQIIQYDTTLSFTSASSFSSFDSGALVNSRSRGFTGVVYDGRYVYYVPNTLQVAATLSGQVTRYDTTLPFSSSNSYAIFDTNTLNSNSWGFWGGVFDGRYIYFIPNAPTPAPTLSGQITRFDTTGSFTSASSYTFFDTASGSSNSVGFQGGAFDGRYLYLVPSKNLVTFGGQVTRIDAYPGPLSSAFSSGITPNGVALGTYSGTVAPPAGGLIVSGSVGIGTPTPAYPLDVSGSMSTQTARSSWTTKNNQYINLATGPSQGGLGSSAGTTNKAIGANETTVFDLQAFVNSNCVSFIGAVFDGRYVYYVPTINQLTRSGLVARYDSTLPFSASASYSLFDMKVNVSSSSVGFDGGIFDGRYIYYIPNINTPGSQSGTITRFDTTLSFTSSGSYSTFDTKANINSQSVSFAGAVFDGRYIYYVPHNQSNNTPSGQLLRFDSTATFTSASSYQLFDLTANVNSLANGYWGGTYDGRYVYFAPLQNVQTVSGLIVKYDTTLPFGTAGSFSIFDMQANVSSNSCGIFGACYDGRYVYMISDQNRLTQSGTVTRYDTTLPFSTATSYSAFDLSPISSLSVGFEGSIYDGRYVYFIPNDSFVATKSGLIVRYDTTMPFTSYSSYTSFDSTSVQSNSCGFLGSIYDGRYIYLVPSTNGITRTGQITRIEAYPGSQATAIAAYQAAGYFGVGSFAGATTLSGSTLAVPGSIGIGTSAPQYPVDVAGPVYATQVNAVGTTMNAQRVLLTQGYSQGGFGGGAVGTNIVLSARTTAVYDTFAALNSFSRGFNGALFDGRYIYFVPNNNGLTQSGQITRFDASTTFGVTSSYAIFDLSANVNTLANGFAGAVFDGRYVYFVPNLDITSSQSGLIVRYDTTVSFSVSTSYSTFNSRTALTSLSSGFQGGAFDGRFVYFIPNTNVQTISGTLVQYDTSLPFSNSTSYAAFDTKSIINSKSAGFIGSVFDGQFLYLVPNNNGVTQSGQITRYNTALPFATATSYSVFDTNANVNSSSSGFFGGVYDGRYLYLVPNVNGVSQSGQITRYDTQLPFTAARSYSVFDTKTFVNSNSAAFRGGVFDGRYLYFVPGNSSSGQITKYDTTLLFSASTSYSVFNTASVSTNSTGFLGGAYDGRYLYLAPQLSGTTVSGQITRTIAYSGPPVTAPSISYATGTFTVTGNFAFTTVFSTSASAGTQQATLNTAAGFLVVLVNGTPQKIAFYNP
ncbi:MAG: hypothetical protein JSS32_06140 [Verrucomicrobia bacterium]|nr:hypothetical protein [Verrucomicrobiota bacterium]